MPCPYSACGLTYNEWANSAIPAAHPLNPSTDAHTKARNPFGLTPVNFLCEKPSHKKKAVANKRRGNRNTGDHKKSRPIYSWKLISAE